MSTIEAYKKALLLMLDAMKLDINLMAEIMQGKRGVKLMRVKRKASMRFDRRKEIYKKLIEEEDHNEEEDSTQKKT